MPSDLRAEQQLAGMCVIAASAVMVIEVTLVCLVWRFRAMKSEHSVADQPGP
jgi:heme/copper-type cytochrome/quinol oxidase subunit 2